MIKRPQKNETLDDILKQHEEFNKQRLQNPALKPAASIIQTPSAKNAKMSIFARSRAQENSVAKKTLPVSAENELINNDIYENILGIHERNKQTSNFKFEDRPSILFGDVYERSTGNEYTNPVVVHETPISNDPERKKSIFAKNLEIMKRKSENLVENTLENQEQSIPVLKKHLKRVYGETSAIVEDAATSQEIHDMNVTKLSAMPEEEILKERLELLSNMGANDVKFLMKRRQLQQQKQNLQKEQNQQLKQEDAPQQVNDDESMTEKHDIPALNANNPAWDLLKRSEKEKWLNFGLVEPHKLQWLHDTQTNQIANLKPGETYEARFDWKGVLLPYTFDGVEKNLNVDSKNNPQNQYVISGNNELFLHGDDEHRPGYTIQELFRLARSNVQQQRVASFEAISGMLSIYQQGFYDGIFELPITKIFFLLRYGFDDNTNSMLKVTSKALANLIYNDSDETLLDLYYDNPHYHRQPCLPVTENIYMGKPIQDNGDDDEDQNFEALENLQKQMSKLNMKPKHMQYSTNVIANESDRVSQQEKQGEEEDDKKAMSDFELAEKDLIDCLVRTNVLQRIWYILNIPRDDVIVSSCLKILIRMARTSSEIAAEIIKNQQLINCLNFYATLETSVPDANNTQVLCLKLIRVLFTHGGDVASSILELFKLHNLLDKYLLTFDWRTLNESILRVQLEILRILRQLIGHRVDSTIVDRKYGNALRYMLEWHYQNTEINMNAPYLLRQHAAAIFSLINMNIIINQSKCDTILTKLINDCCCKWFYHASNFPTKEFSQSTLLAVCLETVKLCLNINCSVCDFNIFLTKYLSDFINSHNFIELWKSCISNSILLNEHNDRRYVHKALPNAGAVIQQTNGPILIIGQNYPMHLLNALLTLAESHMYFKTMLYDAINKSTQIMTFLLEYLGNLYSKFFNQILATNYFAMAELTLIPQLLRIDAIQSTLDKQQIYFIAYRVLCSFSHEHTRDILILFMEIIFSDDHLNVDPTILRLWQGNYRKLLIHEDSNFEPFDEGCVAVSAFAVPLLPMDWPYYPLRVILLNQLNNLQQFTKNTLAERETIEMTLKFTHEIDFCNTISATQQLMYFMIMFMGPDAAYQEKTISDLIREHLLRFYGKYKTHKFQLDIKFFGMSHFEDLYFMFVDHFQASSYGNELFSSLLMVPLAQKYNDKWRKRIWSDFSGALYCIQCNEDLLIGGLAAYLEPAEEDESLILSYTQALSSTPRPSSLLCKIATHHVQQFKKRLALKSIRSANQVQQDGQENS